MYRPILKSVALPVPEIIWGTELSEYQPYSSYAIATRTVSTYTEKSFLRMNMKRTLTNAAGARDQAHIIENS